jgi:uncharacterized protein (TIGR02246 family)
VTDPTDVQTLYRELLIGWNTKDAVRFGELFTDDGSMVGFDGSQVESRVSIIENLTGIFADHQPASYVAKVREIRPLGSGSALLRSVAGMVPPGASDIKPDVNAVQALVAVAINDGWRIAYFQSTPAAFHGRPDAAEALTTELRAVLYEGGGVA